MNFEISGAYTALITPFRNGTVDFDALRTLVDRQIDGGIDGLVPCGTTGEAATMSPDEQVAVIEAVVDQAAGRVPIVAGTGSNDTRKTVEYTRRVASLGGVDAALVVTPYYNKPGQAALVRHYQTIADEGGLPVVLYNVPGRTAVSLTPETIATLARHEQIIAVKEATGDMVFDTNIVEQAGENITLLSGDDFTTMPLLALGGKGCISVISNLVPGAMSKMVASALSGSWEQARQIHYSIQPLARALFSDTNPVPVKIAAAMLGWCTEELRPPLYAPTDAVRERLREALEQQGLS